MTIEYYELLTVQGPPIEFDRSQQLPPDEVSETLAAEALKAVKFCRWANYDATMPVRVLVPGCGAGTLAHGLLAQLEADDSPYATGPIHIDAFDIGEASVMTARRNFAKFTGNAAFTSDVFEADWADQSLWSKLSASPYDLVLFNPPYLPTSEVNKLRPGYETTPAVSLDGGIDGLDHFRVVVPHLIDILEDKPATEALFRFRTPAFEQTSAIGSLITDSFKGKRHFSLRMFPSEGPVIRPPGVSWEEQRWISFGVLCLNPPLESEREDYLGVPVRYKLDSCMGTDMVENSSKILKAQNAHKI
jgi:methylase of polypeptide subunit release factors